MIKGLRIGLATVIMAGSLAANAASITSAGDALLAGSTNITFTEVVLGAANPTIAGVSFAGATAPTIVQNNILVPSSPFLGNQSSGSNGTNINITFATGVSAFGAEFYAVNSNTTLQAFDAANQLLGTILLPSTGTGVNGYLGLGGFSTAIWSARVVTTDYLGIDNFRFVTAATSVPEPGTVGLLGLGLLGAGVAARRRRRAN